MDQIFDDVKRMDKRQFYYQVLSFGMIVSSALMIWKGLMVVTGSESPIVVVLSGSMEPAFKRGDLLFLTNYQDEDIRVGEIVVFKIDGRDIPIVHRVLKVHEKEDGSIKFLTKGDNNSVDDRGLYAPGQLWLDRKDVVGRARGFLPYVGIVTIVMNDYPKFKCRKMKVKEVDRTANIAWSPATQVPIYLAAGTAAQQLDATFSTTSTLELYSLNLSETGHDMPIVASLPVEQRFHKVIWGRNGMDNGSMPSGLIVGGSDRGVINMYDAHKLIKGENSLVSTEEKHTGPVAALDFNPFQSNLLASGASESEIFIWDVNKKSAPMNPGPKSQPLDDVRCISWNRQVQHILASAFASRCLVWDLRKNDPIIKVSDSTSRMRYKIVAWHPDVATQLCLASEDDHTPIIQIWDLRAASSPLKTLEGHTKGILSLAWCKDDSDLLLSCGKDNRILVWNPNSPQGEIVAELPTSNQWSFDVSWCPRNPAVIASSSFDGRVSVYSLMGGQQQVQPTNRITESFGPGMEGLQQPQTAAPQIPMQLKSPPKWLRKPCGASFGFGGKLVSFENPSQSFTNAQGVQQTKNLPQEIDPATEYLNLLGIDLNEINDQLQNLVKPAANVNGGSGLKPEVNGVAADISCMKIADQTTDDFEVIAAVASELEVKPTALDIGFDIEDSVETSSGQLNLALLTGNLELAVKLCIEQRRWADALILSAQAGQAVLTSTQALYFQQENNGGGNGALVEAVAHDSWEKLVTNADLESWKQVLCAVVVYCQQDRRLKLAGVLAARLSEAGAKYRTASTLCYIVSMDMEKVLELWIKETCTPDQLQDMVEVVVMLRAAIQAQGLNANLGADSKLASRLASYAVLLASQGCLQSALVYLGDTGANPQLQELKERLEKAVAGPVNAGRQQPVQQPSAYGSNANRNNSGPGSRPDSRRSSYQPVERKSSYGLPNNQPGQFNTGLPSVQPSFNTGLPGAGNAGFGAPAMQQPVSSYGQPQPLYAQPPVSSSYGYMEPSQPASGFQPPPPAADLPAFTPAGTNPLMRRSRAVDPSIAAGAPGYQNYGGQGGYQQPSYGVSSYGDQQGQFPANNQGLAPQPAIFTPEPISSMATPVRSRNTSESVSAGGALPPVQGFKYTPDHGGPGWKPPVSNSHGWNDPPPSVISKPKLPENPPTPSYMSQGPIFTPLMNSGTDSSNAAVPPPSGGFQPHQPVAAVAAAAPDYQQPANASNGWAGFQPAPQPSYGQGMMGGQPGGQMGGPVAPQPAAPAPEPVPLAPIPAQHIEIQEVLDALLNRCKQASTHPQTKRKLDDVHSKLEILYNKLRKETLSEVTLQGLHQIVMLVRQYDYMSCVQVISGLIAGGSFAELADFMPGIKVLIQVAQQSGVYLEQQQ